MVTQPEFRDFSPSFDPAGRYLYFLSLRTFDPVYDSVQFELSFPRAARPYLIALQARGRPPFEPEPQSLAKRPSQDAEPKPTPAPAAVRVDLDGIVSRIAAFPSPRIGLRRSPARPMTRSCGALHRLSVRTAAADTRKKKDGSSCLICDFADRACRRWC